MKSQLKLPMAHNGVLWRAGWRGTSKAMLKTHLAVLLFLAVSCGGRPAAVPTPECVSSGSQSFVVVRCSVAGEGQFDWQAQDVPIPQGVWTVTAIESHFGSGFLDQTSVGLHGDGILQLTSSMDVAPDSQVTVYEPGFLVSKLSLSGSVTIQPGDCQETCVWEFDLQLGP